LELPARQTVVRDTFEVMVDSEKEEVRKSKSAQVHSHRFAGEAHEAPHSIRQIPLRGSRGPQRGTGAGPIRIPIYFGISEARPISDLIIEKGYI
jgi:hypothetical protein